MKKVKITWEKSASGRKEVHRRTIKALGLNHRGSSVIKELTPQVQGMIKSVEFMLKIEEMA